MGSSSSNPPSQSQPCNEENTSRCCSVTRHSPNPMTRLAKIQPQALNGR